MKITLQKGYTEINLDPADLELEKLCPGTTGEGCKLGRNKSGAVCSTCEGRGVVPTPLGLHLLAFMVKEAPHYRAAMKKHAVK